MKIVIALGGNALLQRGEAPEAGALRANVARAADAVAIVAARHTVIVTHGNGPQVGLLALQAESYGAVKPYPLDILGAETEGMIGYLIQRELESRLPKRQVVTLLTQVEVRLDDPAFGNPSKPIGPVYDEAQAKELARARGWRVAPDGRKWRRVVPSPEPRRFRELQAIRLLVAAGVIVICAGGGGIPVAVSANGILSGVDAVVDKDLAAALLAHQLGADALLMLTDVDAVYLNWGSEHPVPMREARTDELRKHAFAPGSMHPKIEAACRFVESGGKLAGIGRLEDAAFILEGLRGTLVRPRGTTLDFTSHGTPVARPAAGAAQAKTPQPEEAAWVPFELPEDAPPPQPMLGRGTPIK